MEIVECRYENPLQILWQLTNENQKTGQFRGHSDKTWALSPSLLRADKLSRMVDFDSEGYQSKNLVEKINHINNKTKFHFDQAMSLFYQTCLERGISMPTVSDDVHARLTSVQRPITMMGVNRQLSPGTEMREWPIIAMMQHYGFHTPLLDWSKNPLVALFFATDEEIEADGCVWQLNLNALGFMPVASNVDLDTTNLGDSDALKQNHDRLLAVSDCGVYFERPQFSANERLIAQDGWLSFSVFNARNNRGALENDFQCALEAFDLEKIVSRYTRQLQDDNANPAFRQHILPWHMKKHVIPQSMKAGIRDQLKRYRVDRLSVYPGLSHITEHVRDLLRETQSHDVSTSYF